MVFSGLQLSSTAILLRRAGGGRACTDTSQPGKASFCTVLYSALSNTDFNSSLSVYSVKSLSQTECRCRGSTLTSLKCWSPGCQDGVWPDFSWHRFFLEQGSPAGKENISVLGQSCYLLRGLFHATQLECHLVCNEGNPLYLLCWNSCRLQLHRDIWPIDGNCEIFGNIVNVNTL